MRDTVSLEGTGIDPIVVHGGGKAISAVMKAEGFEATLGNPPRRPWLFIRRKNPPGNVEATNGILGSSMDLRKSVV